MLRFIFFHLGHDGARGGVVGGQAVHVAGQVGFDLATATVAQGMEAQARLAFENLKNVLEAAGAGMADIVDAQDAPAGLFATAETRALKTETAIDALRDAVHRPVQATVQSLPEPLFDDPADNATERWNLYLKRGLRVRIEALAQARGVAPSRVVQEILFAALSDRQPSST